ncbi:hypothetical protein [Pseudomonas sp. SG20052]|uniref:hypothetical protein n=1 Tax=Pseudomonas sp. SG20052 TaxID=3074147 RepID=UPI00287FDC07|nr:hypothetical protein [Pseudomonas sp. SG20052]WNF56070.1 hypothetical protein RHP74_01955 [Pseudomonas sp. SG20052]
MASLTQQQKRAKRAKVKAKQQRVARSAHLSVLPHSLPERLGSIDWFEELFAHLLEAENQSRKELFVALFISLADLISLNHDLESERNEANDSSEAMAMLSRCFVVDYRKWAHGATETETLEWLIRPDVIEDFSQAKDEVIAGFKADLPEDDE